VLLLVGCGHGRCAAECWPAGERHAGVDASAERVEIARSRSPGGGTDMLADLVENGVPYGDSRRGHRYVILARGCGDGGA
jgi:hypothetical protein